MARLRVFVVTMSVAALTSSQALAQSGGVPAQNSVPYDVAVRCFVANAIAVGERRRAGDAAKAAYYESMAKKSHGSAYVLGNALGFSQDRITRDFERAERDEAPAMRRDQDYYYRVVGQCKALNFM